MRSLNVGAVSRNYFNMPLWVAQHTGLFEHEKLSITLHLFEAIDEVTIRLRDGDLQFALGVTENLILDREGGGRLEIVGGNVNRLPFSLIGRAHIRSYQDLRGARIGVSSIKAGSSSLVMKLLAEQGLHYPDDYSMLAVGPILSRWEMLRQGEIDAGLQGAPLNYIAIDAGYNNLGSPREQFPDFQFTSLDVDAYWAQQNQETLISFLRAFLQSHRWFFSNRSGAVEIAAKETGLESYYLERAWDEYVSAAIFPRDGRASLAAVQTLIEVSALIRELPARVERSAGDYINHSYLDVAERSLSAEPRGDSGPRRQAL